MLTWPHADSDWGPFLREVEAVYRHLAKVITRFERLLIICQNEAHKTHVSHLLLRENIAPGRVQFCIQPANDTWVRDYGPICVMHNGRPRLLDFRFNGWGNKYPHERDDLIAQGLHAQGAFGDIELETHDLVLEGGSIDSDGRGTLLTTTACLLNPNRNPVKSQAGIERLLKQTLGVSRFLWVSQGWLAGDDTDGHIDMLARFCDTHTIACSSCDDAEDEHHRPLGALRDELGQFRDACGEPYRIVELPIPQAIYDSSGQRLPASYANFLVINQAVLVPQYHDPHDKLARERLQACFPEREIIGIDCRPLIRQYGSLHCISMQLPSGVLAPI